MAPLLILHISLLLEYELSDLPREAGDIPDAKHQRSSAAVGQDYKRKFKRRVEREVECNSMIPILRDVLDSGLRIGQMPHYLAHVESDWNRLRHK